MLWGQCLGPQWRTYQPHAEVAVSVQVGIEAPMLSTQGSVCPERVPHPALHSPAWWAASSFSASLCSAELALPLTSPLYLCIRCASSCCPCRRHQEALLSSPSRVAVSIWPIIPGWPWVASLEPGYHRMRGDCPSLV